VIERDVAERLTEVLGEQVYVRNLPVGQREGVFVARTAELTGWGGFRRALLRVFILGRDYKAAIEKAEAIRGELESRRGEVDGWRVADNIEVESVDVEESGLFLVSVGFYALYV